MRRWDTRATVVVAVVAVLVAGMLTAIDATAATPPLTFGQVAVNQTTKFTGNGFEANEPLAFWVTAPDRTVTPLAGDLADATGAFAVTVSFSTDGFWQVTAHGTSTKKEVIGGYTVGNATTTTPAATVALASVTTIAPNQSVTFSRDGFRPLESVSLWVTGPDSKVTPLDGTPADVSGMVSVPVTFSGSGFWQVTAHGTTSGKEAIVGYNVGDASVVASVTPTPTYTVGSVATSIPLTPAPTVAAVTLPPPVIAAFPTSTSAAPTPVASTSALGSAETRPTARVITGATAIAVGATAR